jgi:hypothetical protein
MRRGDARPAATQQDEHAIYVATRDACGGSGSSQAITLGDAGFPCVIVLAER